MTNYDCKIAILLFFIICGLLLNLINDQFLI